jgi:hypothetical protein
VSVANVQKRLETALATRSSAGSWPLFSPPHAAASNGAPNAIDS